MIHYSFFSGEYQTEFLYLKNIFLHYDLIYNSIISKKIRYIDIRTHFTSNTLYEDTVQYISFQRCNVLF